MASELLPINKESETKALAGAMKDTGALLDVIELSENDFYYEAHRILYRTLKQLFTSGEPVDLSVLVNELTRAGHLEAVGGNDGVVAIYRSIATTAHSEYHCRQVREYARRRFLIAELSDLQVAMGDVSEDFIESILKHIADISEIMDEHDQSGFQLLKEYKDGFITQFNAATEQKVIGVATGIGLIDNVIGGMREGQLIIVAARPAVGKSALAQTILYHVCVENKIPAAIVSAEMSANEIIERFIAIESTIDLYMIRHSWKADQGQISMIERGIERVMDCPVYARIDGGLIEGIAAQCYRLKKREPRLALIVVDYLQLLNAEGKSLNDQQEVRRISKALKQVAIRLNIPVLALAQLNRECERHGRTPRLSDLRDSGAIEQDADIVILMDTVDAEPVEGVYRRSINIAKHRNGRTMEFELEFEGDRCLFTDGVKPAPPYEPDSNYQDKEPGF